MILFALAMVAPPAIQSVVCVPISDGVEMQVRATGFYQNPFDPADVRLDAFVRAPSGRRLAVPGFLSQDYRRSVGPVVRPIAYNNTATPSAKEERTTGEILAPAGPLQWRIRFAPQETGTHTAVVTFQTRQGIARRTITFSDKRATGRVSVRGDRFTVDGQPHFPIGANMSWAGPRGTRDYDDWMPMLARNGGNWARLWLSPNWTTFALERKEIGRFDLANAWRIDYVLDLARRNGVRLQLCVDSYNILRDRINWPEWERTPHNAANGGPLKSPGDFWTNAEMDRLYRAKLRYLVARYGYRPNVFAWEFWNEVDGVTDYQPDRVRDWHVRMAKYLHEIDPWRHPVTTSFGGFGEGAADASVFRHLDFGQSHLYDQPNHAQAVERSQERLGKLGKPHFVGEFGADASGDRRDDDPRGYQIHDPLWASLEAAGGTMPWWWDSYLAPRRLYPIYRPFADVVRVVGATRSTPVTIGYVQTPNPLPRRDVVYDGGPISFRPSPENQPRRIRVGEEATLSRVQHGVGNHPELHNPVTFLTAFAVPTPLVATVASVSGYGGAGLKITIDDQVVLSRDFPDPDGETKTNDLTQFAGEYRVVVPAGQHEVRVENPGQDWYMGGFRFLGAGVQTAPPVIARAHLGKGAAFVWLRHRDQLWSDVVRGGRQKDSGPLRVALPALKGRWRVRQIDTWTGKTLAQSDVQAPIRIDVKNVRGDLGLLLQQR